MRCLLQVCSLAALMAWAFLPGLDVPVLAQDSKGEVVKFQTVDLVEINGTFYPNPRRPVVMLLHPIGEDSRKKEWITLAEWLHTKGFAVLSFDFRGHGRSTDVDAGFWLNKFNKNYVKPNPQNTVNFKDFNSLYYTALVNDIAAAKAFLERRNDNGECNAASTIVIGADTGATLGALWVNSEYHRHQQQINNFGVILGQPSARAEGKDIVCAIWLSIAPKLENKTTARVVNLASLLRVPAEAGMPFAFFFGEEDKGGAKVANECFKKLVALKKNEFTAPIPIPKTDLKGIKLLLPVLQDAKGQEVLKNYLDGVVKERANEYGQRGFESNYYVWRLPGTIRPVPAKTPTGKEKLLFFDTYSKFLPVR